MAEAILRGVTEDGDATPTTVTPPRQLAHMYAAAPPGTQPGDYQLVIIPIVSSSPFFGAVPAGWNKLADFTITQSNSASSARLGIFEIDLNHPDHATLYNVEFDIIQATTNGGTTPLTGNNIRVWASARLAWDLPPGSQGRTQAIQTLSRTTVTNSHELPPINTTAPDSIVLGIGASEYPNGGTTWEWSGFGSYTEIINNAADNAIEAMTLGIASILQASASTGVTTNFILPTPQGAQLAQIVIDGASAGTAPTVDAGPDVPSWTINTEFTRTAVVNEGGLPTDTTWTIQSGPVGQGSTISQTANLVWTPTATGTYTLRATSQNSAGSDFDDMNITVVEASTSLRMYLTGHSTDLETLPTTLSFWDIENQIAVDEVHQLSNNPEGLSEFRTVTESTATQPVNVLCGRWISGPAEVAGTLLADEVTLTMARGESSADADLVWCYGVKVITSTGADRGVMFGVFFSTEWPVVANATECIASSATVSAGNVTAVQVQPGDRVVVEVGYRATNTIADPRSGTIVFGGIDSPDLDPGDTGANLNRPSWIEIPTSMGLTFADSNEPNDLAPGEVFDLSNFKWTGPTEDPNDPGDAIEIQQPALTTYADEHLYLNDQNHMVFVAPVVGETTGGSSATRSELREMENGTEAAWAMGSPDARSLTVTGYFDPTNITGGTTPRKEMIIGQIHGELGNPPLYLAAEYHVATPRVRVYKYNGSSTPGFGNMLAGITPTTLATYRIEYDPVNNQIKVYGAFGGRENLPVTPNFTFNAADFFGQTTGLYFKAGAYNKTTVSSGSTGEAITTVTYLELIQPGDEQPTDPFPQMAFFLGGM